MKKKMKIPHSLILQIILVHSLQVHVLWIDVCVLRLQYIQIYCICNFVSYFLYITFYHEHFSQGVKAQVRIIASNCRTV